MELYRKLLAHYGEQRWWPHETKWEILVGAILTQNTAWTNVEKALANLRREGVLSPAALREIELARLEALVRPAGFTTSKPGRLKTLAGFLLAEYADEVDNMRGGELAVRRAQLLALNGIGPETADAILLYGAEQPIFVIDAYTRRIMGHMGTWRTPSGEIVTEKVSYVDLQELFMRHLPHDVALFQEFHALLDIHAKYTCTKRAPRCHECPLNRICLQVGVSPKIRDIN
jgi:endonuclease-3 related protein